MLSHRGDFAEMIIIACSSPQLRDQPTHAHLPLYYVFRPFTNLIMTHFFVVTVLPLTVLVLIEVLVKLVLPPPNPSVLLPKELNLQKQDRLYYERDNNYDALLTTSLYKTYLHCPYG